MSSLFRSDYFWFSFFISISNLVVAQDFSALFEQVKPSVVVIHTEETDLDPDDWRQRISLEGLGSGILIENDQVLTAAHVVQVAETVVVQFHDGTLIPANVIASSLHADVALLKLRSSANNYPAARLGDSDKIKIGAQIFVVGAPYGLSYSLTVGHISGRIASNDVSFGFSGMEFFQTDAAINEGNSGGPMFNSIGEVIGIVSHIITHSGGNEGLGFAACSNVTAEILLEDKTIWSGVEARLISEPITDALNVPQSAALLIQRVSRGSVADSLGLRPGYLPGEIADESILLGGDIILEVNNIAVEDLRSLEVIREELSHLKSGSVIPIVIWRRGGRVILSLKI